MKTKQKIEDEMNFLEVLKDPSRWWGLIYPYFLIILLLGGLFYVDSLDMVHMNQASPALFDSVNTFRKPDAVQAAATKAAPLDLNDLLSPSKELIAKGSDLYKSTCASCHGEQGMGNGVAGEMLNPKPRNFHETEGWKNGRDFSALYKTLEEGIPGSAMPAYEYLPQGDRVAIIQYVRTLGQNFPAVSENEAKNLEEKYDLTFKIQ